MAKCPLCSQRAGKRYCPAKSQKICSICCGTKREVEIDCPGDCVHLKTGRSFEAVRHERPGPAHPKPQFNSQVLYRNTLSINAIAQAILEERRRNPLVVDRDVVEALAAIKATMKTLSSGIYYETLPEGGGAALALYRRLRAVMEELMQPQAAVTVDALRVSDVSEIVDFVVSTVESHSSGRPKSRQYLDWLSSVAPEQVRDEPPSLILP